VGQPFRVGEQYENRKGIYQVLSMDGDEMRIRWDTGEEITTRVETQARILRNMELEAVAITSSPSGPRVPGSYGEVFEGLKERDFSEEVTGTHWRCREQLGGAVTRALAVQEPFDSWSIYKRPEVHWASKARYDRVHARLQTKFFCRLDEHQLLCGLYVERSNTPSGDQRDWQRFLEWTRTPGHCLWLQGVMLSMGLEYGPPYKGLEAPALPGRMRPLEEGLFQYEDEPPFPAEEFPVFLEKLPDDLWLDSIIGRTFPREGAVAQGDRIAATIAELFNRLMPVYQNERPESTSGVNV